MSLNMPLPKNGGYYYSCEQTTDASGTTSWSSVSKMSPNSYLAKWCSEADTTYIDGGKIYANSVTADKISVTDLSALGATIGGWSIATGSINKTHTVGTTDYNVSLFGAPSSETSSAFLVRSKVGDGEYSNKFQVRYDGKVIAKDAEIDGKITATSGEVGGWSLSDTMINKIVEYGGREYQVALSTVTSTESSPAMIVRNRAKGATAWENNVFRINYNGNITATGGTIGGFTLSSSAIYKGTITANTSGNIALSNSVFTRTINSVSRANLLFAVGSKFGVDRDGVLYCAGATIDGGASVSGSISATSLTAKDYVKINFTSTQAGLSSDKIALNAEYYGSNNVSQLVIGKEFDRIKLNVSTYLSSGTAVTSDRNSKNTINSLDDKYLGIIDDIEVKTFKYNDGNSGRNILEL